MNIQIGKSEAFCPSCGKKKITVVFTHEYDYVECGSCQFALELKDWNKIEKIIAEMEK